MRRFGIRLPERTNVAVPQVFDAEAGLCRGHGPECFPTDLVVLPLENLFREGVDAVGVVLRQVKALERLYLLSVVVVKC